MRVSLYSNIPYSEWCYETKRRGVTSSPSICRACYISLEQISVLLFHNRNNNKTLSIPFSIWYFTLLNRRRQILQYTPRSNIDKTSPLKSLFLTQYPCYFFYIFPPRTSSSCVPLNIIIEAIFTFNVLFNVTLIALTCIQMIQVRGGNNFL